jgi:hypothetical protein
VTLVPGPARADGWNEWEEEYDAPAADAAPDEAAPGDVAQAAGVPEGQWVQTQQYGWVWMPYADAYTWTPVDGYGEPAMYVYRPAFGWCWLAAPWVWGIGPWPYFGVHGYVHFGWYGHGWWRTPHHWHYRPGHFARTWGAPRGGGWRGGPRTFQRPLPAPRGFSRGGFAPGPRTDSPRGFSRGGGFRGERSGGFAAPHTQSRGGFGSAPRSGGHGFSFDRGGGGSHGGGFVQRGGGSHGGGGASRGGGWQRGR